MQTAASNTKSECDKWNVLTSVRNAIKRESDVTMFWRN